MSSKRSRQSRRQRRGPRKGSLAYLLRKLDDDPARRGREFELVCRWYLLNGRPEVRRVWLWNEWPDREGPDCGIDLVAETDSGELWAVQAKAVSPDHNIRKDEVDSFLSESNQNQFARRILIATTDRIGSNARRVLKEQSFPVEMLLRSRLGREKVDWPESPNDLRPARVKSLGLRRHQRQALDALGDALRDGGRAQVVMACGTGKTLVAIRARERVRSRRTLVLVPSLALMKQTIATWQSQARVPFMRLAVCSDSTVELREDEIAEDPSELGVRVTTDPSDVRDFMARDGELVLFSTYQSAPQVAEACSGSEPFDLVVCDEAHRSAGVLSGPYSTVLRDDAIPAARRLFLTATPRHYSGEDQDEAADRGQPLASMDDNDLFGPVVHRLSFGRAIELGLLADYRVVICVVDDHERLELVRKRAFVTIGDGHITDAESLAAQVVVARAMRRFDLSRVLTFHGRVKRAAEFAERMPAVIDWMPDADAPDGRLTARHVHGGMPTHQREAALGAFRELPPGERSLISNVRCLAEGVDVPSIDAVAIIDPKRSRSEITQAIGRALRAHGEQGKVATVIVPAFVSEGENLTAALRGSAFEPVWEVLMALREQDERLANEIDGLRFELGPRSVFDRRPQRIELQVPEQVGSDFVQAFNARLAREIGLTPQTQIRTGRVALPRPDRTDEFDAPETIDPSLTELGLEALERFVSRTGHSCVPEGHREEGFGLGDWYQVVIGSIESLYYGRPEGCFSDDNAERFRRLVRFVDLPFGKYSKLRREIDPLVSLPRFRDAVARGRLPTEFESVGLVRVDNFPDEIPADTTSLGGRTGWWVNPETNRWLVLEESYLEAMTQLSPGDHLQRFEAALIALGMLGFVDDRAKARPGSEYLPFHRGFAAGLSEVSLQGCLIERVTADYRGSRAKIDAHVAGWDLGKKARRDPFDRLSLRDLAA